MGGGERKDKKFVKKIIDQINSNVKELNIVNDKLGTPTYTVDLAVNLKLLIKKNKYGLYHMVCNGMTSRLEVSKQILKFLKKEHKIKINEVESNFFKTSYFARRPFSERLINKKLNQIKLNKMRHWRLALRHYLENYKKK